MLYQRGFRLRNERLRELAWYFTDSAGTVPIASPSYAAFSSPSTEPGKLLAQERYVHQSQEATRRARLVEEVKGELFVQRPEAAADAWWRLERSYGARRQDDPWEEFQELAPLLRFTEIARERARIVWRSWLMAENPWTGELARAEAEHVEQMYENLIEAHRAAQRSGTTEFPGLGFAPGLALAAHVDGWEREGRFLEAIAGDVVERATAVASRKGYEDLRVAMAAEADRVLSGAGRLLDKAWNEVEIRHAVEADRMKHGDRRGKDRIRSMSRVLATRPPPKTTEDRVAALQGLLALQDLLSRKMAK